MWLRFLLFTCAWLDGSRDNLNTNIPFSFPSPEEIEEKGKGMMVLLSRVKLDHYSIDRLLTSSRIPAATNLFFNWQVHWERLSTPVQGLLTKGFYWSLLSLPLLLRRRETREREVTSIHSLVARRLSPIQTRRDLTDNRL